MPEPAAEPEPEPEPAVLDALRYLPADAGAPLPALDLACGRGRHALALARRGLAVDAVDRRPDVLDQLARTAAAESVPLTTERRDLETEPPPDLGDGRYALVVVVNYLHRPLAPAIVRALRPGGVLVYDTFTSEQPRYGRPTNPDFLLQPGELRRLFADLTELRYDERVRPGPVAKATLIARCERPTGTGPGLE